MHTRRLGAVLALAGGLLLFGAAGQVWAVDTDGDGMDDAVDVCNNTPPGVTVDGQGRPLGDLDKDCDTDLADLALFVASMTGPIGLPPSSGPVEMVTIPGGTFMMGDNLDGLTDAPTHTLTLSSFKMGRYEVTNTQYAAFLNAAMAAGQVTVDGDGVVSGWGNELCDTTTSSTYSRITYSGGVFGVTAGKENHPMVEVSWYGADAFCDWYGYRLPTEAEWEYAARGGLSGRRFPWGDEIQHARANYYSSTSYFYDTSPTRGYHPTFITAAVPYTSPVDYFAANGYRLYDMAGNVWDWCSDWYSSTYYSVSPTVDPEGPTTGTSRVLRGGSWLSGAYSARCARRSYYAPSSRGRNVGFRIALDLD